MIIYLSNIVLKNTYQINVMRTYISKKEGKALKVRRTGKYLYQSCLINYDTGNPPTSIGRVRQRLLSPDILTAGGCIKKKCIKNCWECSYENWLGQQIWCINDPMSVNCFPGSAAGAAALKDMRCKFVSLHQTYTFGVGKFRFNLH